jgi:hypothetical protein
MQDELLRAQLTDSARVLAELPVPGIAVLRRRVRRRRIRIGAATLAVGAALGAAGAVVAPWPATTSRPPTARSVAGWQPAGPQPAADAGPSVAPYLITVVFQRSPADVEVVNVYTGKAVATVRPPAATDQAGFTGVEAAGDDRTFFLEDQLSGGQVTFYELRLGADGKSRSLTEVATDPQPMILGSTLPFAVSPDASRLAYATSGKVTVVSLATGAVRSWSAAGVNATDMSWAGDRMLAFGGHGPGAGVRLLDVAAPGSDLMSSRLVALPGYLDVSSPLIAADGSVLYATVDGPGDADATPTAEVIEISVRTGRAQEGVTPGATESGMGTSCMAIWSDPSGQQAVAECGGVVRLISHGRSARVNLHVPDYNLSTARQSFVAW